MSIKAENFRLPQIIPLRKNSQFLSGANKPILITGIDQESGDKDDYVVKLLNAERMSESASLRELLASFIAIELGIEVVNPVVINITKEFANLLKVDDTYNVVSKSIGLNFGSRYLRNYQVLGTHQSIPNDLRASARDIFAFDVLIQNADRTQQKPNMLTNGKELVVLDHELAFGFVLELPMFRNTKPWEIREKDKLWIEKHCLHNRLKGEIFDHSSLRSLLSRLDSAFWQRSWDLTPSSWRDKEQFDMIKTYLNQIVNESDSFIKGLQHLLA